MREDVSDEDGFEFVDHSSDDPVFVATHVKNGEVVYDIGGGKYSFEFSKT